MTVTTRPLAATPPMGWNSWNMFGSSVNEQNVRETAEALKNLGFRDLGYEYVVIDDCWPVKEGRGKDGELVPDPEKFPNGMKALTDHIHSLGFKAGIYSDAADRTCAGYPASYGHEEQDAAIFAEWGFDFLKYDYCNAPEDQETAIDRYGRMGAALRQTGREFLFSLCEWGGRSPHLWGKSVGGQMWRSTGDLFDSWIDVRVNANWTALGVDAAFDVADSLATYGGPGGWNDLDMLIVGLKGKGQIEGNGMIFNEYQTHMSLWCVSCSPLMIGCDVRKIDTDTAALLTNREVLAVNQDPLGVPGRRVRVYGPAEVWRKPLHDGSVAVALFNRGSQAVDITVRSPEIGLLDTRKQVRDLWAGADIADFTRELTRRVEAHQTVLLKITP